MSSNEAIKEAQKSTAQFDAEKLVSLISLMAEQHGIQTLATPYDWDAVEYPEDANSISAPIDQTKIDYSVMTFDTAIKDPTHPFSGLFLYECQSLISDVDLTQITTESPVIITENGMDVNRESPISMGVFLLAMDKTMQSLSAQMGPEFYQSGTVSTAWLARSVSTIKGEPQLNLSQQFSHSMSN